VLNKLILIIILAICVANALTGQVYGFTLGVHAGKEKITLQEEVSITVMWDENVSAARNRFEIRYK